MHYTRNNYKIIPATIPPIFNVLTTERLRFSI